MPTLVYTQQNRPLRLTTPLGPDALLLVGLSGQEGMSQLFQFQLDLLAEPKTEVAFDRLLGEAASVLVEPTAGRQRHFHGIVNRISQGEPDGDFIRFQMTLVPRLWLLTKRVRSRIFQHLSVPDILRKVFEGLEATYRFQGAFAERDYCVQYRESDFQFAARLMEEEGIYYYFEHTAGGHKLVVANTQQNHAEIAAPSEVVFDKGVGDDKGHDPIFQWGKVQELRSGKVTLWDHCFELPGQHLEGVKSIQEAVVAGTVKHGLRTSRNGELEIYDYPGEYAQRFDGVDPGGAERSSELQKIFDDGRRTAEIRMQQEAVQGLVIQGGGFCGRFLPGQRFALARHPHGDGQYLLTTVSHFATQSGNYRSGGGGEFHYHNNFTCIPVDLPFRPARGTPKPIVPGPQTATVVGQQGEEIFTDKYGRVKVQFHWDREGQKNADSSCWVRVGTPWAGKQWGMVHIPRIGQEVIVAFEEGDPDQPLIIGSVYNAENMPPYALPDNKTQSGLKTRSSQRGGEQNFNELRFEDKKGEEDVYFHSEKDCHRVVENDDDLKVGNDQTIEIKNNRTETVKEGDETITIEQGNRIVTVTEGTDTHEVKGDRTVTVKEGAAILDVKQGDRTVTVDMGKDTHQIKQGDRKVQIDMGKDELVISMGDQKTKIDLGKGETEAMQSIELKVGQSSIKLEQSGVTIKGLQVKIEGTIQSEMKSPLTTVKADGVLTLKGGITMIN